MQRSVRVGSGRRGRSGFMKTSVGILGGPSVSRKSFRQTGGGMKETATWVRLVRGHY